MQGEAWLHKAVCNGGKCTCLQNRYGHVVSPTALIIMYIIGKCSYMLLYHCLQLRLHAQHKGREDVFILRDGFEASAAAVSEQYVNINSHGVEFFLLCPWFSPYLVCFLH